MKRTHRVPTALAAILLLVGLAACKTTSSPHRQVDDSAIKAVGARPARNDSFMDPETDQTIKADKQEPAGAK